MIKKALEYIVGLNEANIKEIKGSVYSDKSLYRVEEYIPTARSIDFSTLSGLIDYIHSGIDELPEKMMIRICSPTKVILQSNLNANRDRETVVSVTADLPNFMFSHWYNHEEFCISVQSMFADIKEDNDKKLILKFAGTVESGSVAEYGDDGVTQKASVKTGIASKSDAIVPNPVRLAPFRTFTEVEQVSSDFIFRMNQNARGDITCALFEADGGAWKLEAMKRIANYLRENVGDTERFLIIA